MNNNFAAGDVINHPKFGLGSVEVSFSPNKIEVRFQEGKKLLLHNRRTSVRDPCSRGRTKILRRAAPEVPGGSVDGESGLQADGETQRASRQPRTATKSSQLAKKLAFLRMKLCHFFGTSDSANIGHRADRLASRTVSTNHRVDLHLLFVGATLYAVNRTDIDTVQLFRADARLTDYECQN
jgi:hypothetical protein